MKNMKSLQTGNQRDNRQQAVRKDQLSKNMSLRENMMSTKDIERSLNFLHFRGNLNRHLFHFSQSVFSEEQFFFTQFPDCLFQGP